jgi:adenylylsulfate kinase
MVSIYLLCGLIIANLGLMGYYIGKIFDETKRRPLYVVESTTHDCLGVQNILCTQMAGSVLWITGLSGAGKSTLAHEVVRCLRAEGKYVVLLDGDDLRTIFGTDVQNIENYGREGRLAIAIKYSHLCRLIASQGVTVVIATISLFREVHDWNRANLPGYFEVYLKVPLEELRRRDSKGIYQRFDAGEITYVAGLDLPIDEPKSADWVVEFSQESSVLLTAENLIKKFKDKRV